MDATIESWKARRERRRKKRRGLLGQAATLKQRIGKLTDRIRRRRKKLAARGVGGRATAYLLRYVGRTRVRPGPTMRRFSRRGARGCRRCRG